MTCYDDVMRTIIELPPNQLDALEALCKREAISRAEAIRRAVAAFLQQNGAAAGRHAFGLWQDRPESGLEYQEQARQEWDGVPRSRRTR